MMVLTMFACSGGEDTGELVGDATAGATVYANACSSCHGAAGEGGSGPALTDVIAGQSDELISTIIVDGLGEMPPIDLSDQERADVIAWLRATFG